MRKKGVPDWFTSSLWSSSSSNSNSFRTRSASGSSPTTPQCETRNESETENAPIAGGDLTPIDGLAEEISGQACYSQRYRRK
ncbi:TBC1 domain family member 5-like [Iris pallida]|uniref:TBC1 domain family member 5-like n=1 Tax=Iris pallida TaxID=29817 RepID=A0AAX6FHW2_IRIPA|nr:TBC1 domain family member 5-like [Iris pallida]